MSKLVQNHYDQGLAAYRAGQTLRQLIDHSDTVREAAEAAYAAASTPEDRQALRPAMVDDGHSFVTGFFEGCLEDIRLLAAAQRPAPGSAGSGQRA